MTQKHLNNPGVYLWPADRAVAQRLNHVLADHGVSCVETGDSGVLGFRPVDLEAFSWALTEALSVGERQATRALMFEGESPGLSDFGDIITVSEMLARYSARWLNDMLSERRYKSQMQPIVDEGGFVHGHEFLFRGLDRDGSMVLPEKVMAASVADDALLLRVDEIAGRSALESAWRQRVSGRLFINVLPQTVLFHGEGLIAKMESVMAGLVAPDRVVLEVLESQRIEDVERLTDIVAAIRQHGFSIALDDFGTGFNNLAMIPRIRPDYIKLDKQLVSRVAHDEKTWSLVANVVDAAEKNDIRVIAEGVERAPVFDALHRLGCHYFQGLLYGAPADTPAEPFVQPQR